MWSGPRNVSTAMMRAFANRADCAVSDEPFYAAYLAATGPRPSHARGGDRLAADRLARRRQAMLGPVPGGKAVWYQKHMTHHMMPGFGRDWIDGLRQRLPDPRAGGGARLLCAQAARPLHAGRDRPARATRPVRTRRRPAGPRPAGDRGPGRARRSRAACCARSAAPAGSPSTPRCWPGRRAGATSDGVWAPAWYDAVEKSTGFAPPRPRGRFRGPADSLKPIAEAARPLYERLARHKLAAVRRRESGIPRAKASGKQRSTGPART